MEIKKYPSFILRRPCSPVKEVTKKEESILNDMSETMYNSQGIGLAASQVGVDMRLAVVDIGNGLLKLVNPKILERKGREVVEEGCLSVPNIYVKVKRAKKILVEFIDKNNSPINLEAEGLLARAIQHEIDHLNGRLIIDYLNPIKSFFVRRKLKNSSI